MAFFSSSTRLQTEFMHYILLICWTNILNKQSLEWKRPCQLRQLFGVGLQGLMGTFVPSLWCLLTNQWEELGLLCQDGESQWGGERQSNLASCQKGFRFQDSWNQSDLNPWMLQEAESCQKSCKQPGVWAHGRQPWEQGTIARRFRNPL